MPVDRCRTVGSIERGCFAQRGIIDRLDVSARSAGGPGLLWWERRLVVAIDPVVVAPRPAGPGARIEIVTEAHGAGFTGTHGTHEGDVDGIRPWRDGDSERSVHWPTSLRTGDLVVLDRHRGADTRWIVRVDADADDADVEAGRAGGRSTKGGAAASERRRPSATATRSRLLTWTLPRGGVPHASRSAPSPSRGDGIVRAQKRACRSANSPGGRPRRPHCQDSRCWSVPSAHRRSRLPCSWPGRPLPRCVTTRISRSGGELPNWARLVVAIVALAGVAAIAIGSGTVSGLLAVLRGPLPEFLMLLVVLHGFECNDRRTARVELAISAVVAAYASGLRVDGQLGWWLAVWGACFLSAIVLTARDARRVAEPPPLGSTVRAHLPLITRGARPSARRIVRAGAGLVIGALATVLVLALVPVPSGPATLTLPAFIDESRVVDAPGVLARTDGSITERGDAGDGTRGDVERARRIPRLRRISRHVDER